MTDTRTSDARLGGAAMIAAAIAAILTMMMHPTSRDMFVPGQISMVATLGRAIHIFAIISAPFAFLGALALARHMDSPNRVAMSALTIYGFALVAIMIASALSGLVATRSSRRSSWIRMRPRNGSRWPRTPAI